MLKKKSEKISPFEKVTNIIGGVLLASFVVIMISGGFPEDYHGPASGISPEFDNRLTQTPPDLPVIVVPPNSQTPYDSVEAYGLEVASVVRVVDGDTLVIDRGYGEEKLRLIGIDTPESVHPDVSKNTEAGYHASSYTQSLVAPGQTIWLQSDTSDIDNYGRLLRYVWLSEPTSISDETQITTSMLNAILLINGYAIPTPYEPDVLYRDLFDSLYYGS